MIHRPDTSELMEIFGSTQDKIDSLKTDVDNIRSVVEKRLEILNSQNEYMLQMVQNLQAVGTQNTDKIVLSAVEKYGQFDEFGLSVHPKFTKTPVNIFNFAMPTGFVWKNNATVYVNDEADESLNQILEHDSIEGKDFSIREYDTDEITIEINANNANSLGDLTFNVIEILPYLPGSFNIEKIDLYEYGNDTQPVQGLTGIQNVGPQRFILDAKMILNKAVFTIKLLHRNSDNKFTFGLKHLYFLNANFLDDCYAILRYDTNKYLTYIYDDIIIKSQFGVDIATSATEAGIIFYSGYDGEKLTHEIELSTTSKPSYISTNLKTCYIYLPITTSLISILPHFETREITE